MEAMMKKGTNGELNETSSTGKDCLCGQKKWMRS